MLHDIDIFPTAEAPAIVTGFLPPQDFLRNSSERLVTITAGGGTDGDQLSVDFRTVITTGPLASLTRVDDGQTIVQTLHIGCKAEGRPKADILWYELDQDPASGEPDLGAVARRLINDTERDDVVITEPREGRSVLSVSLPPEELICRRYICEAMNAGGTSRGGVDICTQSTFDLMG